MRAMLDDLYQVEGKAELVGREVVRLMPTGRAPAHAVFQIDVAM